MIGFYRAYCWVRGKTFDEGGQPTWQLTMVPKTRSWISAAGLAKSIVGCLADPATHQHLRIGAMRLAGRFTWDNHYSPLMAVLAKFARGNG